MSMTQLLWGGARRKWAKVLGQSTLSKRATNTWDGEWGWLQLVGQWPYLEKFSDKALCPRATSTSHHIRHRPFCLVSGQFLWNKKSNQADNQTQYRVLIISHWKKRYWYGRGGGIVSKIFSVYLRHTSKFFPFCSVITDFRTVSIFALGPFLPIVVKVLVLLELFNSVAP